jgi:ABC-type transporter Mla subunit MlaD
MEQSVKEMDAAVDSTLEQVEVMNGEIDQLSNQVEILTAQSKRFDSFLEGLNTLIDSLYSPEEQSK